MIGSMKFSLGIKSDPIEYRYTFEWLFALLNRLDIRYLQVGSFFELYTVEDGFLYQLKESAERYRICIKSCFTTHRELGGFFSGDPYLEKAARKSYERYIHVASLLGADSVGSNPGTVPRDRMGYKKEGIECYLSHMKELMATAREAGLKRLTMETMSSLAEPPTLPEEVDYMMDSLGEYHRKNGDTTVPVYICGDISHGYADREGQVVNSNVDLFAYQIPYLGEFHFKNTDQLFNSTFGFSPEEQKRGIVDLKSIKELIERRKAEVPVEHLIGYYETGGPKMGREYSDYELEKELTESLEVLKSVFSDLEEGSQTTAP